MELLILDRNFLPIGVVGTVSSLIWNRKYYETGDFELHCEPRLYDLISQGAYLHRSDVEETGIIESLKMQQGNADGILLEVKGRFLTALLNRRVIDTEKNLSGTGEQVFRSLVTDFAINPNVANRKIARLSLGILNYVGSEVQVQALGENLLDKMQEIAVSQEIAFDITYNYLQDILTFQVWQGKDRSYNQTEHSWAVFSSDYGNVLSSEYQSSQGEYRNFAYVVGEDKSENTVIMEVDLTEGEERRELYVEARDINQKKEDDTYWTLEEWKNLLKQRGIERLSEYRKELSLTGEVDVTKNLIYRKDFNLGDICTYTDVFLGLEITERITEVTETYESGKTEISMVFGNQQFTVMQKMKREVKK